MAIIEKRKEDEQAQGATLGQQPQLGSAPAPTASAPAPGARLAQAPQQPAGGFAGIQAFLNANKGYGQTMADKVRQQVGGAVSKAQADQASQARDYSDNAWRNAYRGWADFKAQKDADLKSAFDSAYGPGKTDAWGGGVYNASTAYNNARNQIMGRQYQLPDAGQFSPNLASAQSAKSMVDAAGKPEGIATLLGNNRQGNYSPMMGNLDAMLISQAAPALSSGISNQYGGIINALMNPTAPQVPTSAEDVMSPEEKKAARAARMRNR